jgi:tRNA threonylcarbamoyladenosine biosynthesis protein TsaE
MPLHSPTAVSRTVLLETATAADTRAFAAMLAAHARQGDRLALLGELGAGKTQFAKGFAAGLGITEVVNSPSFTLMAEHRGRLPLFHLDLYRLSGSAEVIAGGLFDERQANGVTLTEWADRLDETLDPDRLEIRFTVLPDDRRRLELRGSSDRYEHLLEAAGGWQR